MSTPGCERRLCSVNLLGQEGLTTLALIQGDTQPSNLLSAQFRRTMEYSTHQYSSSLLSALRLVKPTDEVESPKYLQKQDRHLQCLKTLPKTFLSLSLKRYTDVGLLCVPCSSFRASYPVTMSQGGPKRLASLTYSTTPKSWRLGWRRLSGQECTACPIRH